MNFNCNCPSCRGEGPPDDEAPEPSDQFIDEWIDNNRDTIVYECLEKINAAWEKYLEGQKEELAIDRAENRAQAEKDDRAEARWERNHGL